MVKFLVTVGGTAVIEAMDMTDAAERAVRELESAHAWMVDVTDIDIGNRAKIAVQRDAGDSAGAQRRGS